MKVLMLTITGVLTIWQVPNRRKYVDCMTKQKLPAHVLMEVTISSFCKENCR